MVTSSKLTVCLLFIHPKFYTKPCFVVMSNCLIKILVFQQENYELVFFYNNLFLYRICNKYITIAFSNNFAIFIWVFEKNV
jgi:hypothetical protein